MICPKCGSKMEITEVEDEWGANELHTMYVAECEKGCYVIYSYEDAFDWDECNRLSPRSKE